MSGCVNIKDVMNFWVRQLSPCILFPPRISNVSNYWNNQYLLVLNVHKKSLVCSKDKIFEYLDIHIFGHKYERVRWKGGRLQKKEEPSWRTASCSNTYSPLKASCLGRDLHKISFFHISRPEDFHISEEGRLLDFPTLEKFRDGGGNPIAFSIAFTALHKILFSSLFSDLTKLYFTYFQNLSELCIIVA